MFHKPIEQHELTHLHYGSLIFANKRDLRTSDLVEFLIDLVGLFTHPFVVRYNRLSLIAIPSLGIVGTFFDI